MPEGYTHVRTAQKAAHALHYTLQCPAAFAAGANGPDSFFCYEVWKKGQNRTYNLPLLGNRMHEDKTGAFLLALLHHTHTQAQIEYTLGFLCHYAADTVMHPYVVFVSSPGQPYGMKGGKRCGALQFIMDGMRGLLGGAHMGEAFRHRGVTSF